MNKIVKLMLLLAGMTFAQTYTLEECIALAVANNHEIQKSQQNLKNSESQVSEAWGNVYPELSFNAKYEYAHEQYNPLAGGGGTSPFVNSGTFIDTNSANYNAPTAALAGDIGNLFNGLGNSMVNDYQVNASLVLTQVLFSQAAWTAPSIAVSYKKMVAEEHAQLVNKIKYEVSQSFYTVLYFSEAVTVMNEGIGQAHKHLEQAEVMHAAGLVSEIDLLRATINVKDLDVDKEKMNRDLIMAKNGLLNKMGESYSSDISITGTLEKKIIQGSKESLYEIALSKRRELRQLQFGKELAGHGVTIARADYFPTLYAGGSYTKLSVGNEWNSFEWNNDVRIFAGVQWNLFNGLKTKEKVVQAKTEVTKMDISVDRIKKGIKLQIESEWDKLQEAANRIDVRNNLIALTNKSEAMISASYSVGKATQLEVLDAELDMRKAKLDYQKALLDYTLAYLALQMATGTF